ERRPVWAPNGARLLFASNRKGVFDVYEKPSSGVGDDEALLTDGFPKYPTSWSPDGQYALYFTVNQRTEPDVFVVPLNGNPRPFPYLRSPFSEGNARFSPDGRWIAYDSNESGRPEVLVVPFTGPDAPPSAKYPISTSGGFLPRWRRDGREIFYLSPDN